MREDAGVGAGMRPPATLLACIAAAFGAVSACARDRLVVALQPAPPMFDPASGAAQAVKEVATAPSSRA